MKLLILIIPLIIILMPPGGLYGKVATVLEEPGKVTGIAVDDQQLYVIEQTTIHIYKLKDYSYVKKFGQKGEGPKEFRSMAIVTPLKDRLFIVSSGKVSYFTKDGVFQSEKKVPGGITAGRSFKPIGDKFIGSSNSQGDDGMYGIVNIYDSQLNKIKELTRVKAGDAGGHKLNLFNFALLYDAYGNKAYVDARNGFSIRVLDLEGNETSTIQQKDYKQRKFTDDDLNAINSMMKKMMGDQRYELMKDRFQWPGHYPIFLKFIIDPVAKKLALVTWKTVDGKNECYIYNLDGKFEKRVLLEIKLINGVEAYPFTICGGKYYQVIDNDEEEQWELHVTKLY